MVTISFSFETENVFGFFYFANALSDSLEIFGEIAPTIYLTSINDFVETEYGIGARYYF